MTTLYADLLARLLSTKEAQITFPNLKLDPAEFVEQQCCQAMAQIKAILEDDSLEDEDCFYRIEAIVQLFESLGSGCGSRHDFG